VCQLAADRGVPTFTHIAYMARIDPKSAAEAYIRLIGYAGATGAHMHICHFNSSSKTDVERCERAGEEGAGAGPADHGRSLSLRHRLDRAGGAFFSDPEFESAQRYRL
jgi:hypothetical protein